MLSPDAKPAADTPAQGGRSSTRKRKQADFFVPDAVKTTDKRVIKEVRAPALPATRRLVESPGGCRMSAWSDANEAPREAPELRLPAAKCSARPAPLCDRQGEASKPMDVSLIGGVCAQGEGTKLGDIPNGAPAHM